MNKHKMTTAIIISVLLALVCLIKYWPSRNKIEDFVIDLYIKIFCER